VTIEFHLGIAVKPHTAMLAGTGGPSSQEVVVRSGSGRAARKPSASKPVELFPRGRLACFLLIGGLTVTPPTTGTRPAKVPTHE
jgi:hypothetical protein